MENFFKLNVLNKRNLEEYYYDKKIFYGGPHKFCKQITSLMLILEKKNILFPFNAAYFKHDLIYQELATLKIPFLKKILLKLKADLILYKDMQKILKSKAKTNVKIKENYRYLHYRTIVFYLIVLAWSPIYLFNWKRNS